MNALSRGLTTKPSNDQLARARRYIEKAEPYWTFARSMPQWVHWYVLREWGNAREFDFVDGLIDRYGYDDTWGNRVDRFLVIDNYKYWVMGDVLNRAEPISNAEVRRRGKQWLIEHGKKVGPGGRLVNVTKRPGARRPAKSRK